LSSYTILGIVPILAIHRDAEQDLQSIKADGDALEHGVILAFLQQAKSDPALLATLAEDWFGEDDSANYSVRKIVSMHRRGKRLWRVKVLSLKGMTTGYRVIYAFDRNQQVFYVLGVPPREIAYDHAHPRIKRLISLYDRLGIS
jgi:mRNA-degrading endonuclease RelE of RelBE toxin-antitoxin system